MNNSLSSDSRSPPFAGGATTQASDDAQSDTTQPSLTSGFGAVIEKECDLQSATEKSLGRLDERHVADLDRILQQHHTRLGANIALLEQRYQALPEPLRFARWHEQARPPTEPRHTPAARAELLSDLVAQHARLLADLDALIGCAPDGLRGEMILTDVSRSHEEMAWMLTALLSDDESTTRIANEQGGEGIREVNRAQESWDNEGGPVRLEPPVGWAFKERRP